LKLKARVEKMEKQLFGGRKVEENKLCLTLFRNHGILQGPVDVDTTASLLAGEGISLLDLFQEVLQEIDGLNKGKLPVNQDDGGDRREQLFHN
jgi:hypothetical protein